jgi:hypothetical protein
MLLSNFATSAFSSGGERENVQVAGISHGEIYGAQQWEEYT